MTAPSMKNEPHRPHPFSMFQVRRLLDETPEYPSPIMAVAKALVDAEDAGIDLDAAIARAREIVAEYRTGRP